MGGHKSNPRAIAAATRPTCATCPGRHDVTDRQGNYAGSTCHSEGPKPFLVPGKQTLGGGHEMNTVSSWPPVQKDQWCMQHPDFMRWWMEHRSALVAENTPTEGAA